MNKLSMQELIDRELSIIKSENTLVDKIGVSQSTIQKIKKGKTKHTVDTVRKVARHFGLKVSDLLDGETSKDAPLTKDEKKVIDLYRRIRLLGASQEAVNFLSYLSTSLEAGMKVES